MIIPKTIILPAFVRLDCAGYSILPETTVSGDCCPSNGACANGAVCAASTPETAIFLNGAYGTTIQNCYIGAYLNQDQPPKPVDVPFDFGIIVFGARSDSSLAGNAADLTLLANRIIDNPAIHARYGAVTVSFSDNTLVADNPSIKITQRGGTAVFAYLSAQSNTFSGNGISVDNDASGNFFVGAKRFPGPVSSSNTIFSCGHAVSFAQFVGDNASCNPATGKNQSWANVFVNGQAYQMKLQPPGILPPTPGTSDNTLGPGNTVTVVPANFMNGAKTGGTFVLKTTAPHTTIVGNTISGGFIGLGVAANGAAGVNVAGTCAVGGSLCTGTDDCKNATGTASACTPSGTTSPASPPTMSRSTAT